MTNRDYEEYYQSAFEEEYQTILQKFIKAYNSAENGFNANKKIMDFRNDLIRKINDLTIKRISSDSHMDDRYYKELIDEFRYRRDDYEKDQFFIKFLDIEVPKIKEMIQRQKFEIFKPEIYNADKKDTLKYISINYADRKFLDLLTSANAVNVNNLDEILEVLEGKVNPERIPNETTKVKEKPKTHREYDLNTGDIYRGLCYDWEKYPRDLFEEMEDRLYTILRIKKLVSVSLDVNSTYYEEKKMELESYKLRAIEEKNPPYTDFFIRTNRDGKKAEMTEYDENIILTRKEDEELFDFFFPLKLTLTDTMKLKQFLNFQCNENFDNNIKDYTDYLELVLIKHSELLEINKTDVIVNKFIKESTLEIHAVSNAVEKEESDFGVKKDFTTSRQVLAIHYLLSEFNVYAKTDKTEVAKFIQFLTGKETGVGKIADTSIYKKVKSPLVKNEKSLQNDLQFVRGYFEKLGLQDIVNKINKEIGSKE